MDFMGNQPNWSRHGRITGTCRFQNSRGSMTAYPTPVTSLIPSMQPGTLNFKFSNISATYDNNEMTIFAIVGPLENGTTVNHVWQAGNSMSKGIPQAHAISGPNIQSMERINFLKSTQNGGRISEYPCTC
ncbi:hypothetical protein P3X46_018108 [Hevea brasiliensis]|uniref:AIR12 DOMON domain-containing protein n=1 Tax=Hevea brasiliensis TaxID=3981 RepID=A0ABQ9LPQ9_HEVBR|nr:hypothetical protein P3X46_018108 [Hevea brasiliensis]